MKLLTFSMILFLILSGCAHTKDYEPAPEMLAPNKDDLANIKTIGVLPATSHVYQSKLLLHDVVHKSMGEGAAEGASYALHGGAGGDIIIDLIIRPVVALVGGVSGAVAAAANPIEKPVNATDKQNQITSAIFTAGLKSITYAENILQSALVDFGNGLASYSFEEVHGIGSISMIEDEQISKKERVAAEHAVHFHGVILPEQGFVVEEKRLSPAQMASDPLRHYRNVPSG